MDKPSFSLIVLFLLFFAFVNAQKSNYIVRTIAFYNVENLFDTIDTPYKWDEEFTPKSQKKWDTLKYHDKLERLSEVISQIGQKTTLSSPDIVGLAEVENETVLIDLVSQEKLKLYNYGIVHRESPDLRGIDVAFLYKKSVFTPIAIKTHYLQIKTRGQLVVFGVLDNEEIYFVVNHWSSRRGGAKKSEKNRILAANLTLKILDSIEKIDPKAKIISMGDFNDNPNNKSIKMITNRKNGFSLNNPYENAYKKGIGSLAYRDNWFLFDQILFSNSLKNSDYKSYTYWKFGIFNDHFLTVKEGRYKGYPFRSYSINSYLGGYSDHFPVYIFILKNI